MPHPTILECSTPLAGSTLGEGEAGDLERLLRVLADRHRLRIVNMLLQAGGDPICVCEFTSALGLAQPTVSYHLKQLTGAGIVERERRASFVYYRLVESALENLSALIAPGSQDAV
jgi:ArsR family transcriptional regulator, arsenate/arsenite/antimonite-responsive transcriptional repressor